MSVPDGAFQHVTGDDPEISKKIIRINKSSRGMSRLEEFTMQMEKEVITRFDSLTEVNESAVEGVDEKRRMYAALVSSAEYSEQRRLADAWVASFFWKLIDGSPSPPTTAVVESIARRRSDTIDVRTLAEIQRLSSEYRFFHWYLEFPEVFSNEKQGFDCMMGNPPWERIKVQEKEFFADYPEIASSSATKRRLMIKKLETTNADLWHKFQKAKADSDAKWKFFRASGRFPLSSSGDVNTFALFSEFVLGSIGPDSLSGIIVPTALATDDTNKKFFAYLTDRALLSSLYDFENRKGIFPGVHRLYKFCLLTVGTLKHQTSDFAFFLLDPDELHLPKRKFRLESTDFSLLNPNTKTCPVFRSEEDAKLVLKIYRNIPPLVIEESNYNPWGRTT